MNNYKENIVKQALAIASEKQKDKEIELKPISIQTLIKTEYPDQLWTVQNLIPKNGITAISGYPGTYKTWIILYLASCIANGSDAWDTFSTTKTNVLIVDEENNPRLIQDRCNKLSVDSEDIHLTFREGIKIDDEKWLSKLLEVLSKYKIGIVFFDALIRIHTRDENSAQEMAVLFDAFKQILKLDCDVAFTHHHRKEENSPYSRKQYSMRGSSEILAQVDSHISLDKTGGKIIVTQTKSRYAIEIEPFRLELVSLDEKSHFNYLGNFRKQEQKTQQLRQLLPEIITEHGEKSRKELVEKLSGDFGSVSIDNMLKELEQEQILDSTYVYRTGKVYRPGKKLVSQHNNTYIDKESTKLDDTELKGGDHIE